MGAGEQKTRAGGHKTSEGQNLSEENEMSSNTREESDGNIRQGGGGPPNDPSGGDGVASGDSPWDEIEEGFTSTGWEIKEDSDDSLAFSEENTDAIIEFERTSVDSPTDVFGNMIIQDSEGEIWQEQEQIKQGAIGTAKEIDAESNYKEAARQVSLHVKQDLREPDSNRLSGLDNHSSLFMTRILPDSNTLTVVVSASLIFITIMAVVGRFVFTTSRTASLLASGTIFIIAVFTLVFMQYQDVTGTY